MSSAAAATAASEGKRQQHMEEVYKALGNIAVDATGAVAGTYVWAGAQPAADAPAPAVPEQALVRGADGLVRVAGMSEFEYLLATLHLHFDPAQIAGPLPVRVPGTGAEAESSFVLLNKLYGVKINVQGKGVFDNVLSLFTPVAPAVPPVAWTTARMRRAAGDTVTLLMDMPTAIYLSGYEITDQPLTRLHESGLQLFGVALRLLTVNEDKPGRTRAEVLLETARSAAEQRRGPLVAVDMYAQLYARYNGLVAALRPGRSLRADYAALLASYRAGDPARVPPGSGLVMPTHAGGTAAPLRDNAESAVPVEDRLAASVAMVCQTLMADGVGGGGDAVAEAGEQLAGLCIDTPPPTTAGVPEATQAAEAMVEAEAPAEAPAEVEAMAPQTP